MKITTVDLFRYTLPLVEAMRIKDSALITRSGLVVKLTGDSGAIGYGEIAPLPTYSGETLDEAIREATAFAASVATRPVPEGLESFDGEFDRWFGADVRAPSVRFGFELAVLSLLAQERGVPLRRMISETAQDRLYISGLLGGNLGEIRNKAMFLKKEGYGAVKLKVGRYDLPTDVQTTLWLCEHLGDEVALRLDANRAWDFETAVRFGREVSTCSVGYIEEPVDDAARLTEFVSLTRIPVAMDETLRDLAPEDFRPLPGVKAIILKPTVLGLEKSIRMARKAREGGVVPVVSSTYESGLGLCALAGIAAALQPDGGYAGLDTYEWLDGDILRERAPLRRPFLDTATLDEIEGCAANLDEGNLQKISHA